MSVELHERVKKLRKTVARERRWAHTRYSLAAAVVLCVASLGWTSKSVVRSERLELVDTYGNLMGWIAAEDDGAVLQLRRGSDELVLSSVPIPRLTLHTPTVSNTLQSKPTRPDGAPFIVTARNSGATSVSVICPDGSEHKQPFDDEDVARFGKSPEAWCKLTFFEGRKSLGTIDLQAHGLIECRVDDGLVACRDSGAQ